MNIQKWKINEAKSKKNDNHKTVYFVTKNKIKDPTKDQFQITQSYQGDWQNDLRQGFGDLIYKNGDLYSG